MNDEEFKSLNELIERDLQNKNSLPFEMGRLVEFSKTNSNTVWIGSATNSFFRYDLIQINIHNTISIKIILLMQVIIYTVFMKI